MVDDSTLAREFAVAFRSVFEWAHRAAPADAHNKVSAVVVGILGADGAAFSVVNRSLSVYEQVNLQAALNEWSRGRQVAVHGFTIPPHHQRITLAQLVSGEMLPPLQLSAPAMVDLPCGPGRTLACLCQAVLEVTDERGHYVVLVNGPTEHEQLLSVEVAGLPVAGAQQVLAELDGLRSQLNVYRGQVVEVGLNPMGGPALTFADLPATARADVVLSEPVLRRVERHALGIAEHRQALLAAGQHLKRGLLLYGPPGTGKTHTTRYVVGQMTGSTRFIMSGRSLQAISAVAELARQLEPAVVVLEDVDLVAEDRTFGPGSSPVLFELLDAMDGAAGDTDLLFLLTTNRADLLEPALATRPGRVDVAVEIGLPDTDARGRLLDLYSRGVPLSVTDDDRNLVLARTEGVTASFIKELVRRAVLEAVRERPPSVEVTGTHLTRAADDLLDAGQAVTRTLLGVGVDPTTLASPGPGRPHRPGRGASWTAYTPLQGP